MINRVKGFFLRFFGHIFPTSERRTEPCPVCGGTMVDQKPFVPDPYWDANFHCEDCSAYSDGCVIYTDVPKEEWTDEG